MRRQALIVGGGIAGLCAAISLRLTGWDVQVFEQAPEITEIGAGLQISPNGVKILEHIGVMEGLNSVLFEPEAIEIRMGVSGRPILYLPMKGPADRALGCALYTGAPRRSYHRFKRAAGRATTRRRANWLPCAQLCTLQRRRRGHLVKWPESSGGFGHWSRRHSLEPASSNARTRRAAVYWKLRLARFGARSAARRFGPATFGLHLGRAQKTRRHHLCARGDCCQFCRHRRANHLARGKLEPHRRSARGPGRFRRLGPTRLEDFTTALRCCTNGPCLTEPHCQNGRRAMWCFSAMQPIRCCPQWRKVRCNRLRMPIIWHARLARQRGLLLRPPAPSTMPSALREPAVSNACQPKIYSCFTNQVA